MTQDKLKEILNYDEETGIFKWKISNQSSIKVGDIAGHLSKKVGYTIIGIDNEVYPAHRLAWLYVCGQLPKNEIDHINHIKDDNRICNLREVTHTENSRNQKMRKDNKSGATGVYWYEPLKKWQASIRVNNILIHLGYFKNIKDAVKARNKAKIKYGFHKNHS